MAYRSCHWLITTCTYRLSQSLIYDEYSSPILLIVDFQCRKLVISLTIQCSKDRLSSLTPHLLVNCLSPITPCLLDSSALFVFRYARYEVHLVQPVLLLYFSLKPNGYWYFSHCSRDSQQAHIHVRHLCDPCFEERKESVGFQIECKQGPIKEPRILKPVPPPRPPPPSPRKLQPFYIC